MSSQQTLKTDNSGIIMPIVFNNNETVDRFGELRGIYEHERVEGSGVCAVFLDVRWLKTVKGMVIIHCIIMRAMVISQLTNVFVLQEGGRVSYVKRVANSPDNANGKGLVFAHEIYAQNVVFWEDNPFSQANVNLWTIYREADTRIQWK
jgi:hypothetical protein